MQLPLLNPDTRGEHPYAPPMLNPWQKPCTVAVLLLLWASVYGYGASQMVALQGAFWHPCISTTALALYVWTWVVLGGPCLGCVLAQMGPVLLWLYVTAALLRAAMPFLDVTVSYDGY